MHELSIATEIIKVISEHMTDYPDSRVEIIKLAVGEYSGVEPEALRMAFPFAAENSPAEGSELEIQMIPAILKCLDCGENTNGIGMMFCSMCGSRNIEFVSGKELEIISFEISDDK